MGTIFYRLSIHDGIDDLPHKLEVVGDRRKVLEISKHPVFMNAESAPAIFTHGLRNPFALERSDNSG
jgi:hypothetical protein